MKKYLTIRPDASLKVKHFVVPRTRFARDVQRDATRNVFVRAHARPCRDDVCVLADGNYDAIVVDAEEDEHGVRMELTITAGAQKGEVVAVRSDAGTFDPLDILGIPARLVVVDGAPRVELER